MMISEMTWFQVEEYLKHDDRAVLPIGSTEQHGFLSLSVDTILPEKVARDAAEPLGVPVFPTVNYGITPYFKAFPGTVSLRIDTMLAIVRDILDALFSQGFHRILIVNGHGGNTPINPLLSEWMNSHRDASVKLHDWWRAPKTMARVLDIDAAASHASWMENFPWTRLEGAPVPNFKKDRIDFAATARVDAGRKRERIAEGNYHGVFQRPDHDMMEIWKVAVEETRHEIEQDWH